MQQEHFHRFVRGDSRFVIDPETCFCFECDEITWDVLDHYPGTPVNRIYHLLESKHDRGELVEVISELEWLRATKSIIPFRSREAIQQHYQLERGLKRLTVSMDDESRTGVAPALDELVRDSLVLLLARSGEQRNLLFEMLWRGAAPDLRTLAGYCEDAFRLGRLAGKSMTVALRVANVRVSRVPAELGGHKLAAVLEFTSLEALRPRLKEFLGNLSATLPRLAKALRPAMDGASGRIVLSPGSAGFSQALQKLDEAGFARVELDLDAAYVANPGLEPAAVVRELTGTAEYYARRLLKHHYFRLDPIAALFKQIYNGAPAPRSDPAGTNELAVDRTGSLYPSRLAMGVEAMRVGDAVSGSVDEDVLTAYEDVGSLTTPDCMRCWVRNMCGGGRAAVHHALTCDRRTPHRPWCDGQRDWMAACVAAFNLLSAKGVNFERVHGNLARASAPSLFALARAAFRVNIGIRPIEESDAEVLTRWENWSEAAYFLFNESGLFLATKYDREMDSVHPRGIEQELMLLRKSGEPFGLLKIRPDRVPGLAQGWVFMDKQEDYRSRTIQKSFRAVLKEAGGQASIRQLLVPAGPCETGLCDFLQATGFEHAGVLREALYLHGRYLDVDMYSIRAEDL